MSSPQAGISVSCPVTAASIQVTNGSPSDYVGRRTSALDADRRKAKSSTQ